MLQCPHCEAEITTKELYSQRLLRPRTCRDCGGHYLEGGTTLSFAVIAAAGTIATQLKHWPGLPEASPLVLLLAAGAVTVFVTNCSQPIPASRFRITLLRGLLVVPLVGLGVLSLLGAHNWAG